MIKEIFTGTLSTVIKTLVLSLLFFFVSDYIFATPNLNGKWVFTTEVEKTSLSKYMGMELTYHVLLRQEGLKIIGTGEKVKEKLGEAITTYTGKDRINITIAGYIQKKYLSKDKIVIHYAEHGLLRTSSTLHYLEITGDDNMFGTYESTVADQSGTVGWKR